MPWSPGPIRSDVFRLGRFLGAQGLSEAQIASHLALHHGDVRAQERSRAAEYGARWGSRITGFSANRPTDRPPREWFLRNSNLTSAYRYTVTVTHYDPFGQITGYNTVLVDSSKQLTLPEIWKEVQTTYAGLANQYARFRQMPIDKDSTFELLLAERRSG